MSHSPSSATDPADAPGCITLPSFPMLGAGLQPPSAAGRSRLLPVGRRRVLAWPGPEPAGPCIAGAWLRPAPARQCKEPFVRWLRATEPHCSRGRGISLANRPGEVGLSRGGRALDLCAERTGAPFQPRAGLAAPRATPRSRQQGYCRV